MEKKTRILVCPLDWGLGHATRCVPIIRELIKQNAEVIIAADNRALYFLEKEFPELQAIKFHGFNVRYASKGNMLLKMGLSVPGFLFNILKENRKLKSIIHQHEIDGVISDNRFGLWNKRVPCIYLTHQVSIISPVLGTFINKINRFFISNYTECWIPDNPGKENLSGKLSGRKNKPANAIFIGPLSRFNAVNIMDKPKKYDLAVILSGPEPQRTIFETKVIQELKQKALKAAIIKGVTENDESYKIGNIDIFSHLGSNEFQAIIEESEVIISRPGYSTLMDLAVLNKKAVFVPTPGQTEQEYLGKYLAGKGMGIYIKQEKFSLDSLFLNDLKLNPVRLTSISVLKERVSEFLRKC
ncbi:MAG: glycosyltransferase [Bacteroidetes bacterium]|nr:glycosyltransferase [Bacteroidota bacterium]